MKTVTLMISDEAFDLAQFVSEESGGRPEDFLARALEGSIQDILDDGSIFIDPDDLREIDDEDLQTIEDPGGGVHVVGDLDDDLPF